MPTIYLPVAAADVLGIATTWSSEREKTGKDAYTIITNTSTGFVKAGKRMFGKGALRLVPSDERLYVMIHGDGNNTANSFQLAGQRDDGEWKAYTPQTLARHLDKEGLTKAITDIRLAACNGGRPDALDDSFASMFKGWMVHRGYRNVTVYAYDGEVLGDRVQLHDGRWIKQTAVPYINPTTNVLGEQFYRLSKKRTAF